MSAPLDLEAPTLGELVAAARARAGLTLRGLSDALAETGTRLSVPFLHDVEHDRRTLAPSHWRSLVVVLRSLTVRRVAEARARTGVVKLRAGELTDAQRAGVVEALTREAEGG